MAIASQQGFLKPGFYRVGGRLRNVSARKLGGYMNGTRRMLADGLSVPVFEKHEIPGSDEGGPQLRREDIPATKVKGWLSSVSQDHNGALDWKFKATDPETAKGIENGSIRFSSPELMDDYHSGNGTHYGPVIRHMALTPTPRNPDQGPMQIDEKPIQFGEDEAVYELPSVVQFSMDDYEEDYEDDDDDYGEAGPEFTDAGMDMETPKTMSDGGPDMSGDFVAPSTTIPRELAQQINASLETCGIAAPTANILSDVKGWLGQLDATLRQKQRTEADSEAEAAANQQDGIDVDEEHNFMSQYSESKGGKVQKIDYEQELIQWSESDDPKTSAMARRALAEHRSRKQEAIQYAEEKRRSYRESVEKRLEESKLPASIIDPLRKRASVMQFSDGGDEAPSLTILDALDIYEQGAPSRFQFSDGATDEVEQNSDMTTEGLIFKDEVEVSEEEASKIAAEMAGYMGSVGPTHQQETFAGT